MKSIFLRTLAALLIFACSSSLANAPRPHSHLASPILTKLNPPSLLFEVDSATAQVDRDRPRFLRVIGRSFGRHSSVLANGTPVRTLYVSSRELKVRFADIDKVLLTDPDNDRRRYVDISVRGSHGQSQSLRYTEFTEGNAGG